MTNFNGGMRDKKSSAGAGFVPLELTAGCGM